jgi:hypothetical protein
VKTLSFILMLALGGCATSSQRLSRAWDNAGAMCKQNGLAIPSPEFSACREHLYAIAVQGEEARMNRAAAQFAAGMAILAQPQPQPAPQAPATVVCRQSYSGVYCQ